MTEQKNSCHGQETNEGRERGQRAGELVLATCPFGGQLGIQLHHLCESLSMRLARLIGFGL